MAVRLTAKEFIETAKRVGVAVDVFMKVSAAIEEDQCKIEDRSVITLFPSTDRIPSSLWNSCIGLRASVPYRRVAYQGAGNPYSETLGSLGRS